MSLYTSARKCILTIDEGPFLCNCFLPGETGRGVLTPLDYPAAPGWDSVRGRRLFMLTPRPLGGRDKWPDDLDAGTDRCYITSLGLSTIP